MMGIGITGWAGATWPANVPKFDFDIRPTAEGPRKADRGQCAVTS